MGGACGKGKPTGKKDKIRGQIVQGGSQSDVMRAGNQPATGQKLNVGNQPNTNGTPSNPSQPNANIINQQMPNNIGQQSHQQSSELVVNKSPDAGLSKSPDVNIKSAASIQQNQPTSTQHSFVSANTNPKDPIYMQNLYLIGYDDFTPKIVRFNPQNKTFETIQVPAGLELYDLSGVTYLSEKDILLTGGLDSNTKTCSKKTYHYNAQVGKYQVLAQLQEARYAHITTVYHDKLFVIGGFISQGEEEPRSLASVETLSLKDSTAAWTRVASMTHPRACGFAAIYNDKLYVMAGYSGDCRRTKRVECYNEAKNQWDVAEFKLPRGLEYAFVCPGDKDELHIIGGNVRAGVVPSNLVLNLKTNTFTAKRSMHKPRVFHKGIATGAEIWIFGGEEEDGEEGASTIGDTIEFYDQIRDEWNYSTSIHYRGHVQNINQIAAATPPLIIHSRQESPTYELAQKSSPLDHRNFLFGDEQSPFVLEINFTKRFTREKPVPNGLKLFSYQGICKLDNGKYLLCGGLDQATQHISKNVYIYDADNNTVAKVAKCNNERYTCNLVRKGHHVYAIGGRSWGEDNQALLASCERYDTERNVWERLPDLNYARCSGMTFVVNDQVIIVGGYRGENNRWENAEVFNDGARKWEVKELGFPGLEGSGVLQDPTQNGSHLIIQGRTNEGDMLKIIRVRQDLSFETLPGSLQSARALTKATVVDNHTICMIDGDKALAEFYDLERKQSTRDDFEGEIENAITKALCIDNRLKTQLTKFALA